MGDLKLEMEKNQRVLHRVYSQGKAQTPIDSRMDKYMVAYSHNRILCERNKPQLYAPE